MLQESLIKMEKDAWALTTGSPLFYHIADRNSGVRYKPVFGEVMKEWG